MIFCQKHWEDLRTAIKERGLEPLVAANGHAVVFRWKQELAGTETDSTYDPLMAAHNMISTKALEMGGLYLLIGDLCPLCELNAHAPEEMAGEDIAAEWIKGCTDSILEYCQEHKLILPPSLTEK